MCNQTTNVPIDDEQDIQRFCDEQLSRMGFLCEILSECEYINVNDVEYINVNDVAGGYYSF